MSDASSENTVRGMHGFEWQMQHKAKPIECCGLTRDPLSITIFLELAIATSRVKGALIDSLFCVRRISSSCMAMLAW